MYYSQIGQDAFVVEKLNNKRDGCFLDIGCNNYKNLSNTYFLEKELNWNGIGVDNDCSFKEEWEKHRRSVFICSDAVNLDYEKILNENNMPQIIDYLSLDLEPPKLTLQALKKLFETNYSFNIVTFETDWYREKTTRDESRELFKQKGFIWVQEVNAQDDYYIHQRLVQ